MTQEPGIYRQIHAKAYGLNREDGPFKTERKEFDGVAYQIYSHAPETLRDVFIARGRHFGAQEFLRYGDDRLSFDELLDRAATLAGRLVNELGVKKGDRVAIAMRNCPEWMIAFLAIAACGGIVVPLNSWWEADELGYALGDSGAKLVFADAQRLARLQHYLERHGVRAILARGTAPATKSCLTFDDLCNAGKASDWPGVSIADDDAVCIMYTSGSTGAPKGVVATNRGLVQALWFWLNLGAAVEQLSGILPSAENRALLLNMPLFHVAGCYACFLLSLISGRRIVMMNKWDAAEALRLIEEEKITHFNGAPAMVMDLLNASSRAGKTLDSLVEITGSGAATPPARIRYIAESLPQVFPQASYGMTETCGVGALIFADEYQAKPDSVGLPNAPIVEIRLVAENGRDAPPGAEGEIWIKSIANMSGYWNKPEATREIFQDGWLRSGDLGRFDEDGCLYIVGRIKEIIIRGGENVSCNEIEALLFEHPDIEEACIYGEPDERLGEIVAASIVPRAGANLTAEAVRDFLAPRLARFKIPERIDFQASSLPRLASGKIDRRKVRQLRLARLADGASV